MVTYPVKLIEGVSCANVDECAMYGGGYFFDGCLIDTNQNRLPAFDALRHFVAGESN